MRHGTVNIGARIPRPYPLPRKQRTRFEVRELMDATHMSWRYASAAIRGEIGLTLFEADRLACALDSHIDAMWPELAEATVHLCEVCGLEPIAGRSRYCSINHKNQAAAKRKYAARLARTAP